MCNALCFFFSSFTTGDPKISAVVTKIYLKYSYKNLLQSTPPVTGSSNSCCSLSCKHCLKFLTGICQGPPVILIEPLQHQQSISVSNPASSVGKKVTRREIGQIGGWDTTSILFLAKNC